MIGVARNPMIALTIPLLQTGLSSSYFQDVKAAAGKEIFELEYPLQFTTSV